jgi:hypothetical protein
MSEASCVLFFVSSHLTDSGISLEMQGNYFISVLKIYKVDSPLTGCPA